ncbi:ABC transporter substrate-binding protein [Paenibacillus sp. 598K]|uniref:extracellular solute-binding protein n=1 Tax=Paenibacillus sp. 598K TaxID=1117987 RepID=UPI000FF9D92D|nr:extracellular solute-binding protein [Paenibacillus sp. 598K]GBF72316.1 ABC transporter substrate-binding protein [Paenibacillus sp. 598K]
MKRISIFRRPPADPASLASSARSISLVGLIAIVALVILLSGCAGLKSHVGDAQEVAGSSGRTTLTIELFDRNNAPQGASPITDNFMTRYIQEQFGDPNGLDIKFVTVPRSEEEEKLNVLMMAGQAPDIIFTYNDQLVHNFITKNLLVDLGPLLEQHGPELKRLLGEDVLRYGRFEGKQYAIPAKRVLTAQSTTFIREDWLEQAGLPLPATTEQFYEALQAFKTMGLGRFGEHNVPYGYVDPFHTQPLLYSFLDWARISEEDRFASPAWLLPGSREAYRFLNKLYHEGLIDPDFALQMDKDTHQFQKNLVNGRIGAATPNTNEPVYMGYLAELQSNDPKARLTPIDPFTTPQGKRPKPVLPQNGMYIMVPRSSANAEAAIRYLNWMAEPEHYLTLQNGILGVTYEMVDGLPVALDNEESNRMLYNYFDYCILLNGKFVHPTDEALNRKANASDPRYESFTVKSIEYAMHDTVAPLRIDAMIPSEIKYAGILEAKVNEMFVKIITADPEAFDDVVDREFEDYMRLGGAQVIEDKREAYRREHGKPR